MYSLPENGKDLLGSPVPIIVGIAESIKYVAKNILPEYGYDEGNDTIYYFLEEKWIFAHNNIIETTPVLNFGGFFFDEILGKYQKLFSKKASRV